MKKICILSFFLIFLCGFSSAQAKNSKTQNNFDISSLHTCSEIRATIEGRWFLNKDNLRIFVKSGEIQNTENHGGKKFKIEGLTPFLAIEFEEGSYDLIAISRKSTQFNQMLHADDQQRLNQDWYEIDVSHISDEDRENVWLGFSIDTETEDGDQEIFYVHDRIYIFSNEKTTGRDRRLSL